ncbi:MAG: hypothetical protein ACLFPW_10885 [Spirochaetaceae bacterium]
MQLIHTEIPVDLLRNLPEGIKVLSRHGKEYLVVERLHSSKGESLMSETVRIHGEPSIRLGVRIGETSGIIFVDAFWGSHAKLYSFIPETGADETVLDDVYVPESHTSLLVDRPCDLEGCSCKKSIELMLPEDSGVVYVCARLGCPGHRIELKELPKSVSETVSRINFIGEGDDEFLFTV